MCAVSSNDLACVLYSLALVASVVCLMVGIQRQRRRRLDIRRVEKKRKTS